MLGLFSLLVNIVIIALLLWVLNTYVLPRLPANLRKIIVVIVVLVVILWLLGLVFSPFGLWRY